MASKKISELAAAGALTGTELAEVVQAGVNVQTTTGAIAALATGSVSLASQSEVNAGTDNTKAVSPLTLKNRDGAVATLSDSSTTDITSDKWTWATSASVRTTTYSFTGDFSIGVITLTGTSLTITFPASTLCVFDALESGDNTVVISGVTGDSYLVLIEKIGSNYFVSIKKFGQ